MLDVATLGIDSISREIRHSSSIWMSGLAVITLVVVVRQGLPVIIAAHAPSMVKVVVFEVERFVSRHFVDVVELGRPILRRLGGVQVDPNKPLGINLNMNTKKAVIALVKTLHVIVSRCFGKLSVQTIRPPMIFARKYACLAFIPRHDREGSMAANVMEAIYLPVFVLDEEELESCLFEPHP
ncbi:hypothetical protein HG530_001658 [Fusarium avenaceum]|nr:hypothetical protein HG530_001658 [Fusarium avenaceum]